MWFLKTIKHYKCNETNLNLTSYADELDTVYIQYDTTCTSVRNILNTDFFLNC